MIIEVRAAAGLHAVMFTMLWRGAILLFALAAGPAAARATAVRTAAWTSNDISVTQTLPGQEEGGDSSRFQVGENGDARIEVTLRNGSTHTAGTILLIAGRWLLSQGFDATPGQEIHALDAAALNSQLVIVLLTAALPKGPPDPGVPQHVNFTEKGYPIHIATATASREYGAPWTVEGTVSVQAARAPATFRLSFSYSDHGRPMTNAFAGSVASSESPVHLPDSMKVAGWTVRRIGAQQERFSDRLKPGSGTGAAVPKVATIGDLRRLE